MLAASLTAADCEYLSFVCGNDQFISLSVTVHCLNCRNKAELLPFSNDIVNLSSYLHCRFIIALCPIRTLLSCFQSP